MKVALIFREPPLRRSALSVFYFQKKVFLAKSYEQIRASVRYAGE